MTKKSTVRLVALLGFLFLPFTFAIGALETPTITYPTTDDTVWKGEIKFEWTNTGSTFYNYFIDLPSGESKSGTILSLSISIYDLELGNYTWRIRSCNNKEGRDTHCGAWSNNESFEITSAPAEFSGGLIPCGRKIDDASTTLDESKPCGISHIFLLLKNLLNFALWRLGVLIIAVMAVVTAAISYFSFGAPGILIKIKSIWKSVIIGYLIAILAWLLVNLVLGFFGFQEQIFTEWWQVSF